MSPHQYQPPKNKPIGYILSILIWSFNWKYCHRLLCPIFACLCHCMLIRISPNFTGMNCAGENPEEPYPTAPALAQCPSIRAQYGCRWSTTLTWSWSGRVSWNCPAAPHWCNGYSEGGACCLWNPDSSEGSERTTHRSRSCHDNVWSPAVLGQSFDSRPFDQTGHSFPFSPHWKESMESKSHSIQYACLLLKTYSNVYMHQFHQFANFQPALYRYSISTGICKWVLCTFAPCYPHTNIPVCLSAKVCQMMQKCFVVLLPADFWQFQNFF